jgi:GPH family glycoside/pentoside/hexuronide:cation symporter
MTDSHSTPTQPALQGKLRVTTKLAYAIGDFGTALCANILLFFQLIFLTNVAGLPPVMAGSVRTIGGIWDAINDPLIGVMSDRTKSRWGRRYPWMFCGALPLGISFFLSWIIPAFSEDDGTQTIALFWFYVVVSIFFNASYTAVNLPYSALTPELTKNYDERTSLNQFRFTFSVSGGILALIMAQVIFSRIEDPVQQYLFLGALGAIFCTVTPYLCILGTRRRIAQVHQVEEEEPTSIPYLQQLKLAFSNKAFLCVVGIYLFSWLALQNTAAIIPYFVGDWMGLPAQHAAQAALAVQGTAVIMLSVWSAVSKRVGKKAVYFMGMTVWIIAQFGLVFLQPDQVGLMYFYAVLAGFGVATAYLVPWSMIPDVIDLDELRTGQRREGIFYGFMVFLQKIGLALGQLLVSIALQTTGFDGTADVQPPAALLAIRATIGPLPALFLVLGLIVTYFYPITREAHTEILLKLEERKQAKQAEIGNLDNE